MNRSAGLDFLSLLSVIFIFSFQGALNFPGMRFEMQADIAEQLLQGYEATQQWIPARVFSAFFPFILFDAVQSF